MTDQQQSALTRRSILAYGSALPVTLAFGSLVAAPPASNPALAQQVIVRREIHSWSEADLQRLRVAVKALKDRSAANPNDPLGFDALAAEHALHCIGAFPIDPGEVHFGWWFLPWHRAFLRAMELRLQHASGDSELALPYWNWERFFELPPAYAGASGTNSLAHDDRFLQPVDPVRLRMQDVLNSPDFSTFGGAAFPPFPESLRPGLLELFPHGHVHIQVGGDMGAFATAALDPIFWAHHANVDRIWEVWLRGNGHSNSTDPDWLKHSFTFPGPDGTPLSFSVGEMLKPELMGYRYDEVDFDMELSNASGPIAFGNEPFSTEALNVPDTMASVANNAASEPSQGTVVIAVEGLLVPGQPAQVDVFVTPADSGSDRRVYAGSIPLVPGQRNQTGPKIYVEIPVPPQLAKTESLIVTLDRAGPQEVSASFEHPMISADSISIKRK